MSSLLLDSSKIKTKAISEPAESSDGLRYFIVRYPMNVGRKHYFQWIPEVAPSAELLRQWKNRKITWKIFYKKYNEEINTIPEAQNRIHELRELVKQGQTITLLCFEAEFRHVDIYSKK